MTNLNLKKKIALLRPRITEKAAIGADRSGVYVFEVAPKSTKQEISASVKAIYKVEPVRVRTANIPDKQVFIRGKWGVRKGGKKAYVYLKKGDKIELI